MSRWKFVVGLWLEVYAMYLIVLIALLPLLGLIGLVYWLCR